MVMKENAQKGNHFESVVLLIHLLKYRWTIFDVINSSVKI